MKREFSDESFEAFLKRNADNLRMKAPERLWQNLSAELDKNRHKLHTGLSAFFLATCILAYLTTSNNPKQVLLPRQVAQSNPQATLAKTELHTGQQPAGKNVRATGLAAKRNQTNPLYPATENKTVFAGLAATTSAKSVAIAEKSSLINDAGPAAEFTPTIDDNDPALYATAHQDKEKKGLTATSVSNQPWPLSIESVVNTYRKKASRFQTEFHFTPTISYRKLSENKSYLRATPVFTPTSNYAAFFSSVNNMVTHKPDIGFEVGVTEKYSLSQKLRIKAGLQFNVNRYDIKAFKEPYSLATIALNTRGSSRVDSVLTLSTYSNVDASSNKSSWLQNLSFQVSAPVGFELTLKGNDKMQFGIASTIQPTYVLGDRAYLITTDYKSYTQVPWLLRRWNVNTAFETFVAYKSGKAKWQVGPQVRYQLLSSFITNYPVKENLFDFGLKIGVSINQ